jgi:hypothetical protein
VNLLRLARASAEAPASQEQAIGPAAQALAELHARLAELGGTAERVSRQDAELERVVNAAAVAAERLRAAREARRDAEADTLLGRDAQGAATERDVAVAAKTAATAEAAADTARRARERLAPELAAARRAHEVAHHALPVAVRAVLVEQLGDMAGGYWAALQALVVELERVAVVARAIDVLSPRIPGSAGAGAGAVMHLDVGRPRHPAFAELPQLPNLAPAVYAGARTLLMDMGVA